MPTNADKPMFSIKDVVYFLTLCIGFCIQYFTIKLQIHDAVVSIDANKVKFQDEVTGIHKQVDDHTKQISTLEKNFIRLNLEAVKTKDPELEPE